MSQALLASAKAAFRRGRLVEAKASLAEILPRDLPTDARQERQALLAELHLLTGCANEARLEAQALLDSSSATALLRSKGEGVLGSMSMERGAYRDAIRSFEAALSLAHESGIIDQVARTQLKLMSALADRNPEGVSPVLWSDVRRNVLRIGDAQLLAQLHITQARIEARRGLVGNAWRHIRLAEDLLKDEPNLALESVLHLDASALCGITSEHDLALQYATASMRKARESGYARTYMAALGNLGLNHAYLGDFHEAEKYLVEALSLSKGRSETQAAFLDSYAQLKLLLGDVTGCATALEQARSTLPQRSPLGPSWYEVSMCQTSIRLHLISGRPHQARIEAVAAREMADLRLDPMLGVSFRVMEADALVALGRIDEACRVATETLALTDRSPLTQFLDLDRLQGKLFTLQDRERDAELHFGRALRILSLYRAAWPNRDISEDFAYLRIKKEQTDVRMLRGDFALNVDGNKRTANLVAGGLTPLDRSTVKAVAGLINLAEKPELLGTESLHLFKSVACVHRALMEVTDEGGRSTILGTVDLGQVEDSSKEGVEITLGSERNKRYRLRAWAESGLGSGSTLSAVRSIIQAAVELETLRRREKERTSLWPADVDLETGVGIFASSAMHELLAMVERVATTDVTVLITGETGVGKELIAREVHRRSRRAGGAFVPFNCAAVPKDMLESQLFGYRRGAFTGASDNFPGVIRSGAGGSLFLDEIGELGLDVQPKLLRYLESNEVHPLGEARPIKVDVRTIAATNVDLERLVRERRFRDDLYYRLNVVCLHVPPLRERREEVPLLAEHFLDRYAQEMRKARLRLTDEALEYLVLFRWPGNIRQLANEIRRIVALAPPGADLVPAMLSREILASRRTIAASRTTADQDEIIVRTDQPLASALEQVERVIVQRALAATSGHLERAAAALGISRKGLFLKRRRLGIRC